MAGRQEPEDFCYDFDKIDSTSRITFRRVTSERREQGWEVMGVEAIRSGGFFVYYRKIQKEKLRTSFSK